LKAAGQLSTEHVRLAAQGLHISERTVWRHLAKGPPVPPDYQLSETDREAFAYYRGNIAAVHRARTAALSTQDTMGAPVPDFLASGWAQSAPVSLRTLQRAFRRELTPAQLAAWRRGEEGRRDPDTRFALLYVGGDGCWEVLSREPMLRSRVFRRLPFKPLDRADVPALIRRYHPIYHGVADELLLDVDDTYAHGTLRDWAAFTHTAADLCRESGRAGVDAAIAANAYTLLGGGVP
jgi:hypothetical protein